MGNVHSHHVVFHEHLPAISGNAGDQLLVELFKEAMDQLVVVEQPSYHLQPREALAVLLLPVCPELLDTIILRLVGQVEDGGDVLLCSHFAHHTAPMGARIVPEEGDLSSIVSLELLDEVSDVVSIEPAILVVEVAAALG